MKKTTATKGKKVSAKKPATKKKVGGAGGMMAMGAFGGEFGGAMGGGAKKGGKKGGKTTFANAMGAMDQLMGDLNMVETRDIDDFLADPEKKTKILNSIEKNDF